MAGEKYSWTQPVCTDCWFVENSNKDAGTVRVPVVVHDPDAQWGDRLRVCCKCGRATTSGIYIRVDPESVSYPEKGEE